ncbi:hypothetical protein FHX03_000021 [Rhizobium sp. BK456]|nr:hypothetical protein [Rhizobium sp. BK456]
MAIRLSQCIDDLKRPPAQPGEGAIFRGEAALFVDGEANQTTEVCPGFERRHHLSTAVSRQERV